jgi:O-antigen ligase
LRFYAITNSDAAVGFFANRNHQASLLVAAVPFAAVIAMSPLGRSPPQGAFRGIAVLSLALILVVGLGVTRSRAGVLLLAPAFLGGLLVTLRGRLVRHDGERDWGPVLVLAAAVVLGAGLVAIFSLTPLADRFQSAMSDDLRFQLTPLVAQAGFTYAPLGTGAGSFETVYQMLERPQMVMHAYVNHAHNDYVEIWLEAGVAGVALVVAFILWWLAATARVMRSPDTAASAMALAGAVVIGLILAHSAADYPLRTPALATVFAMACGLMIPSARGGRPRSP